jgi:hypothetical protein
VARSFSDERTAFSPFHFFAVKKIIREIFLIFQINACLALAALLNSGRFAAVERD